MRLHSDEQLVALSRAGEAAAFEELLRRHQGVVRNWLRRLCGDATRADDMAQDAFIRAWQCLGDYRGEGGWRSWLLKIAYSSFLQHLRKHRSERGLLAQVERFGAGEPAASQSDELPDLDRLLAPLTPEERACMLLCYSHGYSHGEVSALLEMPLGTVKSHIRRSLLRIRETFGIQV